MNWFCNNSIDYCVVCCVIFEFVRGLETMVEKPFSHALETVAELYEKGNRRHNSQTSKALLDIGTFWEDYLLID